MIYYVSLLYSLRLSTCTSRIYHDICPFHPHSTSNQHRPLLAKPRGRLLRQLATAVVEPGLGTLFSDGFFPAGEP